MKGGRGQAGRFLRVVERQDEAIELGPGGAPRTPHLALPIPALDERAAGGARTGG